MKKTLALLLVAVMAITCTLAALCVSAEEPVYTDKVNLLPANEKDIRVNGGTPIYKLKDGKLSLTRDGENDIAWPSIAYDVNLELDLAKTPYLHLSFETSGEGDRGVNGHLNITDANGNEFPFQISMMAGNGVDDFRDTDELYVKIDLAKAIQGYIAYVESLGEPAPEVDFDVTGKLTITYIDLSVYGGMGETIVWNTLALAKEGEDEPEPTPSEGEESGNTSDETTPAEGDTTGETTPAESTSTEAPAESSTPAATSSTPAESSVPATGDNSNLILFVVLGVVALAGVAVVVKVRH